MKTNEVILQMHPLSCHLALLLRRAPPGSLGSVAGWGLWGERWLSWTFHQGHFLVWPRLEAWRFFLFPGIVGWFFLFSEFGIFHNGKIGTKMTHIQILLNMSTHRPFCVLFFKLWISFELCVHLTWHNCIWHLFHQSKHKAIVHLSSFPTWSHSTHRRIQAWGPTPPTPSSQDARRRPCTAELLQGGKHTSAQIIRPRSPPCPTWRTSWGSRRSWMRRGWGSLGWEVTLLDVSPRAYFCLAKAWGLDFLLSISQYCWITFFGA